MCITYAVDILFGFISDMCNRPQISHMYYTWMTNGKTG